jgi:hypothetical protein
MYQNQQIIQGGQITPPIYTVLAMPENTDPNSVFVNTKWFRLEDAQSSVVFSANESYTFKGNTYSSSSPLITSKWFRIE